MHYLYNEGKVVRKFAVRAEKKDELISFCGKIKDAASKVNAKILYEKELTETCHFMIIVFEDEAFMIAWESFVVGIKIEDIISCKILVIKDDAANNEAAIICCKKAKEEIYRHQGFILKETKVTDGEYRLFVFFTNKEEMLRCEELLGVKGM